MNALMETMEAAGFVGPLLIVCALLMWYGLGYRLWALRGARGSFDAARDEASRPLELGLKLVVAEASARPDHDRSASSIRAAAAPAYDMFRRNASAVRAVVVVAPLAGLLGTVTGMIETFDSLGSMTLFGRGGGIGAGISEAMISTQMGLVVSVPGLLIGALLDRKQTELEDELDQAVERLSRKGAL